MSEVGRIIVVGLGYVGLPLAVALARKFEVFGFDVDAERVAQLRSGHDRTRAVRRVRISPVRSPSSRPHRART